MNAGYLQIYPLWPRSSELERCPGALRQTDEDGPFYFQGVEYIAKPLSIGGAILARSYRRAFARFAKKIDRIHPVVATVFANVGCPHGGVRARAMKEYQWRRRFASAGGDKGGPIACGHV
ncbi:MAG TPA: hypothetical protein VHR27_08065 [Blastocatellia bacterium]|jgi:hypothetical protein|nr:hypothetical protein [Blastocatellia bacterium]